MSHPATPNLSMIQCSTGSLRLATSYVTDLGNVKQIEIEINSDGGVNIPATATLNADGFAKFQALVKIVSGITELRQTNQP